LKPVPKTPDNAIAFPLRLIGPRYWPMWLGAGLMRGISLLPFPAIAALGSAIGELARRLHAPRRRIAARNIELCFPEMTVEQRAAILRQHFRFTGQSLAATGVTWWASRRRLLALVRIHDRHHYDAALAAGRNTILLAPHFVSLEVGGVVLSTERPMVSMYQYAKNELADVLVRRGRSRFGGELFERKGDMRTLIRTVRSGKPFYYLPDQDAGRRRGIFAPFFGIPASTYPVLSRFAQLSGALVIPCVTLLRPDGRGYDLRFYPALENFPSGDVLADTAAMNKVIEGLVREFPAQYFWLHKRFKTRPEGEPPVYST
jgi:KDO2-lipid IV(A) lauroyltransferase